MKSRKVVLSNPERGRKSRKKKTPDNHLITQSLRSRSLVAWENVLLNLNSPIPRFTGAAAAVLSLSPVRRLQQNEGPKKSIKVKGSRKRSLNGGMFLCITAAATAASGRITQYLVHHAKFTKPSFDRRLLPPVASLATVIRNLPAWVRI